MSGFTDDECQVLYQAREIIAKREKDYKNCAYDMLGHWTIHRLFRDVQELLFQLEHMGLADVARNKKESEKE